MLIARGEVPGPRRARFRSFFGFGGMPNADALWGANGWFSTAKDGLGKVPDFISRWGACQALSSQVDAIRGDPLASGVSAQEREYSNWLIQRLKDAAYNFEWGSAWKRTDQRQQALDAALADLDRGMTGYLGGVGASLESARSAIAAREDQQRKAAQAAADAERARQEAATAEDQRVASELLLKTAKTVAAEKIELVKADIELVKAQKEKEALISAGQVSPVQASMGPTLLFGVAGALGLGIYLYASKRRKR